MLFQLKTSSTSRLKYAAIRSINSADGARSPRSTLPIVLCRIRWQRLNPLGRPCDSRISLKVINDRHSKHLLSYISYINKDTENTVLKFGSFVAKISNLIFFDSFQPLFQVYRNDHFSLTGIGGFLVERNKNTPFLSSFFFFI